MCITYLEGYVHVMKTYLEVTVYFYKDHFCSQMS